LQTSHLTSYVARQAYLRVVCRKKIEGGGAIY